MDISARFADSEEVETLKTKQYKSIPTELGEVLLPPTKLRYDTNITFGLKRFLWNKTITIEGIQL